MAAGLEGTRLGGKFYVCQAIQLKGHYMASEAMRSQMLIPMQYLVQHVC